MPSLSTFALAIRESVINVSVEDRDDVECLSEACESTLMRGLVDVTDPAGTLEQLVPEVFSGALDAFRSDVAHHAVAAAFAATAVARAAKRVGADTRRIRDIAVEAVRLIQRDWQLGGDALTASVIRETDRWAACGPA